MMSRTYRSAPALSPGTAKALIESLASHLDDDASSSSGSPDSLYSNSSPTFPDHALEYDVQEDVEVEQHDEDEYESLMASINGWSSPAWGMWPETTDAGPGWTPSPKETAETPRKRSIISISPRGSVSHGRRASGTPASKIRFDTGRRDSDPSLLGFNLTPQTQRSSTKSLNSNRRRSSVLSIGSTLMDSVEDVRLRNVAGMDGLRRRFSEVVEVTCPSDSGSDEDDTAVARATMSGWSPHSSTETEDEDDDDSEIHTAPYFPTPELPPTVPAVLSNFPLASVAQEYVIDLHSPSNFSPISAQAISPRLLQPTGHRFIATPPPPTAPSAILRARSRPEFGRATTDYQFPPRSDGVPVGAAPPRPMPNRSLSTPAFSAACRSQEAAVRLEKQAAVGGSFPMARSVPVGISKLRTSLRRQSVMSDSETSRRSSLAERRASQDESRRASLADQRESLSDRRLSVVKDGPIARRMSSSISLSNKTSGTSRKSSISSLCPRKNSLASLASRKSSVASILEYAYLAPQIVVDAPVLPAANTEGGLSARRGNAPSSLVLPLQAFPFSATAPNNPYSPLESFLGLSSPSTPVPLSPLSPSIDWDITPMMPQLSPSIMDRGRPVGPVEFRDSFLTTHNKTSSTAAEAPRPIPRKAVPQMSFDDLVEETRREHVMRREKEAEAERRFERAGATDMFSASEQVILRAATHRRTISVETKESPRPTSTRRQITLPVELEQVRQEYRTQAVHPRSAYDEPADAKPKGRTSKRASVTFVGAAARAETERINSTSSFTRFFHGKLKSSSPPQPQTNTGKPARSSARPVSLDGFALGSYIGRPGKTAKTSATAISLDELALRSYAGRPDGGLQ